MEEIVTFCLTLLSVIVLSASQRVAPGVPPQQYQQYQQPQYQQPPMQPHQVPVQQAPTYQQPIQQQFHEPQQQGHPQGHAQGHHHPHGQQPQQLLNTANIALEKEHIQEHLDVPIDTSKMTEQELQFHYFKMHDADNNNKLDGCELIKSLIHWHENEEGSKDSEVKPQKDSDLEAMIDPILQQMDTNKDGFVDYAEFKKAS